MQRLQGPLSHCEDGKSLPTPTTVVLNKLATSFAKLAVSRGHTLRYVPSDSSFYIWTYSSQIESITLHCELSLWSGTANEQLPKKKHFVSSNLALHENIPDLISHHRALYSAQIFQGSILIKHA